MSGETNYSRRSLLTALGAGGLAALALVDTAAARDELPPAKKQSGPRDEKARVHIHPALLSADDTLTVGPAATAKRIEISGPTILVWVDLAPAARFAHPTQLVLISAEGTRVVDAEWWPVVNGRALFRDNAVKVTSPFSIPG